MEPVGTAEAAETARAQVTTIDGVYRMKRRLGVTAIDAAELKYGEKGLFARTCPSLERKSRRGCSTRRTVL